MPRPSGRPRFVTHWLPVLLYLAMIFMLSSQPHLAPPLHFSNADKLFHLMEYGGLGVLLARLIGALRGGPFRVGVALVALAVGSAVGATDECYQSIVPGRQSSVFDWMADTSGCALAQLAWARWTARG